MYKKTQHDLKLTGAVTVRNIKLFVFVNIVKEVKIATTGTITFHAKRNILNVPFIYDLYIIKLDKNITKSTVKESCGKTKNRFYYRNFLFNIFEQGVFQHQIHCTNGD